MNDALNGTPILVCFVTLYRTNAWYSKYHKSLHLEVCKDQDIHPMQCNVYPARKNTLFID